MKSILLKIKEREEYESQLVECAKPLASMSEDVNNYLQQLESAGKGFNAYVYQNFYWYKYFECMLMEVFLPLVRTYSLILKRNFYPIFFEDNLFDEGLTPCTYSEAFKFFQEINVSDRKTILQRWVTTTQYVDLIDCIERNDEMKFAEMFSSINNAVEKLGSINFAKTLIPIIKVGETILEALAQDNVTQATGIIVKSGIEKIAESYDWSKFESICLLVDDALSDSVPGIRDWASSLKTNQDAKKLYERLLYPLINATDFTKQQDVDSVNAVYEEWGNVRKFVYFWKDFAELSLALIMYLIVNGSEITLTRSEQEAIDSIINNPNNEIASSRLRAILRWSKGKGKANKEVNATHKVLPAALYDPLKQIKIIGSPYFEAAQKGGFIDDMGSHLKWNGTKALLAYFCGRIFCGDYTNEPKKDYEKPIWQSGGIHFPDIDLYKLFNETNLSQIRRNRIDSSTPPVGYILIDELYERVKKSIDEQV